VTSRTARALLCAAAGLVLVASPGTALACPSCYGATEGPLIDAARVGMWLLLGVTLAIQGAFALFFLYLRKKAREAHDQAMDAEWSSLQRAHDLPWRNV
jgi:hypothetical protein